MSKGLRNVVRGAADGELLHSIAERVRVQGEDLGRPARPLHDPSRLTQDVEDVVPFRGLQCGGLFRNVNLAGRRLDTRG